MHRDISFKGPNNNTNLREEMISKWEKFASKFFKKKSLVEEIAELRKEKNEEEKEKRR